MQFPSFILAHGVDAGGACGPHDWQELLGAWAAEPFVYVCLAISATLYLAGLVRLWRAAGVGHGVKAWEAWCFAGGWLALFVALASPLHPWGSVLFSAHMTQHEVLMLVAAPLLVLGRPLIVFLRGLPAAWAHALGVASNRRWWAETWGAMSDAFSAWLIHAVVLWVWHVPALFQATLESRLVHTLQHASFLGSALLFWWAVIHGRRSATTYGLAVLYMFTTATHSGVLGVLLTLAKRPWYPAYSGTTGSWGLTPLEDQQLGGLIMWIPAGLVYVVAGIAFTAGWLRESNRRAQAEDRKRFALAGGTLAVVFSMLLITSGCDDDNSRQPGTLTAVGDPDHGKAAIEFHGCGSCHTIPGIHGADGLVGPSLEHVASRSYLGGVLPNTRENIVRWIEDPPAVDPQTAMPKLHVSETGTRDIAGYLYTLK